MPRQKSVVQQRGQVTIPANLREEFEIQPGDEVVFRRTDEGILITTQHKDNLARLNQLLQEMNEILREKEEDRSSPYTVEEMIESLREKRGDILKEVHGLTYEDD